MTITPFNRCKYFYSNEKIRIQLIEFLLLFFDANDLNCLLVWSKPSTLDNPTNKNQSATPRIGVKSGECGVHSNPVLLSNALSIEFRIMEGSQRVKVILDLTRTKISDF